MNLTYLSLLLLYHTSIYQPSFAVPSAQNHPLCALTPDDKSDAPVSPAHIQILRALSNSRFAA